MRKRSSTESGSTDGCGLDIRWQLLEASPHTILELSPAQIRWLNAQARTGHGGHRSQGAKHFETHSLISSPSAGKLGPVIVTGQDCEKTSGRRCLEADG
jgi:hypothetical protein